jgi:hypothetical protein
MKLAEKTRFHDFGYLEKKKALEGVQEWRVERITLAEAWSGCNLVPNT